MKRIIALGIALSGGLALLIGGFLIISQPQVTKSRGVWWLWWEAKLSTPQERHHWTTKLLASNMDQAGRLSSLRYVTWVGTATQCRGGFVADRARFLEVSYLTPKEFLLAWETKDGIVCRVAVLSESPGLSPAIVSVAKALLGTHRHSYPPFLREGEVISLVDHRKWLRDGKLTSGCLLKPLGHATKFGRVGVWPGIYYIFGEDGSVLEVGFFFS